MTEAQEIARNARTRRPAGRFENSGVAAMTDIAVIGYQTAEYDEVREATDLWNGGQNNLFDFACLANSIVGKRDGGTVRLAKRIKRRVDTVERYAAAGALWLAMLQQFPDKAEIYRDALDVSFWMVVGAKFKSDVRAILKRLNLPHEDAYRLHPYDFLEATKTAEHWLGEAKDNKWVVEVLREKIAARGDGEESPFTRATKRIVGIIEKDILNAPALNSGMNDAERRVFIKVSSWLVGFLKGKGLA